MSFRTESLFILLMLLLSEPAALPAQNNTTRITYAVTTHVDSADLARKFSLENPGEQDQPEIQDFVKGYIKLARQWAEEDSRQVLQYYFRDSLIRQERALNKMSADEFILIDPVRRVMKHCYTSIKGVKECQLTPLIGDPTLYAVEQTWQADTADRQVIVGYDCYRITVEETRTQEGKQVATHRHILYVTNALALPAYVVAGLWKPWPGLCALEATSINPAAPNSFTRLRAVGIEHGLDDRLLELPEAFRNAPAPEMYVPDGKSGN